MSRKYEHLILQHEINVTPQLTRHLLSFRLQAALDVYLAFNIFQKSMGYTFFDDASNITGVETTKDPGGVRRVILKHKQGLRITLKEHNPSELWVFWILPEVSDSKQLYCPYTMSDWDRLIEVSSRAATHIPLPPLRVVQPSIQESMLE
jgi:hypothetical protein